MHERNREGEEVPVSEVGLGPMMVDPIDREGPLFADPDHIARCLGRTPPKELWEFAPWGRRVVIARQPPAKQWGRIHLPRTAQKVPAIGWVVSVGPLVGTPSSSPNALGWCPYPRHMLPGTKVLFGRYAGSSLPVMQEPDEVNLEEEGYGDINSTDVEAPYVVLDDHQIWGELPTQPETNL